MQREDAEELVREHGDACVAAWASAKDRPGFTPDVEATARVYNATTKLLVALRGKENYRDLVREVRNVMFDDSPHTARYIKECLKGALERTGNIQRKEDMRGFTPSYVHARVNIGDVVKRAEDHEPLQLGIEMITTGLDQTSMGVKAVNPQLIGHKTPEQAEQLLRQNMRETADQEILSIVLPGEEDEPPLHAVVVKEDKKDD